MIKSGDKSAFFGKRGDKYSSLISSILLDMGSFAEV